MRATQPAKRSFLWHVTIRSLKFDVAFTSHQSFHGVSLISHLTMHENCTRCKLLLVSSDFPRPDLQKVDSGASRCLFVNYSYSNPGGGRSFSVHRKQELDRARRSLRLSFTSIECGFVPGTFAREFSTVINFDRGPKQPACAAPATNTVSKAQTK